MGASGKGVIKQIDLLLKEIEELKAIFILGQRVIPFLEELFYFVREVGPMLEEINKSLEESSSKIPKASNQLDTVTRTTEMATTEILDTLDEMSLNFGEIKGLISAMRRCYEKQRRLAKRIGRYIEMGEFEKTKELWRRFYGMLENCNSFEEALDKLTYIKQRADNIMIALQFQDITAQQISAINHLIGSVQEKLTDLLGKLTNLELRSSEQKFYEVKDEVKGESFNPMAQYDSSGVKQKVIDEIIKNNGFASQKEIDKLFNDEGK